MVTYSSDALQSENPSAYPDTSRINRDGKFANTHPAEPMSSRRVLKLLARVLFEKKENTVPAHNVPIDTLTAQDIQRMPADSTSVIRLGHSSLLLKIANQLWLIDPVLSERASPFSFMGPKRFHPSPISASELPDIDGVIISHNHYDHMDEATIKSLHHKVKKFVMPLGNAKQLTEWGVPREKISELDWWQSIHVDELELVATPAQHFSGRGINDRDKALWSSWVIRSDDASLFFSGDSGYFDGFKQIGRRFGPFDLTMMENGAYDRDWREVHMSPKESIQAHMDVKGRKMLPIHNGTFDLAFHEWTDPFDQLVDLANREWIDLLTPKMGQVVTLNDEDSVDAARDLFWWKTQ